MTFIDTTSRFYLACRAPLAALLALTALALQTQAQGPMPMMQPPGMNASITRLFGGFDAFTAQAEMSMKGKRAGEDMAMTLDMAFLKGKMRTELDMTKVKGGQIPQDALGSIKQMGMDRMVTIVRPDQKKMLMVYPGLKAYTAMDLPEDQAKSLEKTPKIEKTEVGRETIDGHPCVKNKVVITDDSGKTQEGFMWNATDLKDFPIRMQFDEDGSTLTMTYRNVELKAPDASRFDAPAGFTSHGSVQELMQAAAMRMIGGAK